MEQKIKDALETIRPILQRDGGGASHRIKLVSVASELKGRKSPISDLSRTFP